MATREILIIGGEPAGTGAFEASLARLGYAVTVSASSPDNAIALAMRAEPDLVLIDLAFSAGVHGIAVAEEVRRCRPTPIVFVTGAAENEATLRSAGATEPFAVVAKAATERELGTALELALCGHGAARLPRELEDRFFAVSIDMLCFLDFNGYFKRLNPAWERTLGFTLTELMSRPFIEFVHPDDRERTLEQNARVREGGHAIAFENRYLCKDGSHRWLLWNAAPDAGGQVIYSAARDITASKLAAEEREQLVRKLQVALAEVKTLQAILPICSYCRKIRDDEDYWQTVEGYVASHTNSRFSHGICPSCYATEIEPQLDALDRG